MKFRVYTLWGLFQLKSFCTSDMGNAVQISCYYVLHYVSRVTQSVRAGLVRDLIPVEMEFSAHRDRHCDPHSLLYKRYLVYPGG